MSLGPLTTSFTPPASCLATSALYWINTASTFYWLHGQPLQSSCFPSNYSPGQDQYYEPGVCPGGYTAACRASTTNGAAEKVTRTTCCPEGDYACAPTSNRYDYPWGPTLRCMSVYRVDTTTSFITIDGTPRGGETAGTPMGLQAPCTVMAYGVVVQDGGGVMSTTATAGASGSASSVRVSETGSADAVAGNSQTDISSSSSSSSSSSEHGGLSSGAAIGIAVAAGLATMALGGALLFLLWSRKRKRKQKEAERLAEVMRPNPWESIDDRAVPLQPAVQVNWQPVELASEREAKEIGGDSQVPVEKDGTSLARR
ncbi:uncharacterized protein GGS25DRAFT_529638 [Hypoxylon fragiforme]|uniref:uncharacterized protein n=1 Tax=Hypoxylon fragiforme TaxID=63214 RepID=UPI0020C5EB7B|nr:uncharacterized protein GGS25DRAFT_529638 [Hypoxylon fragiforme]KAI2610676.1 hypothetical protein GGS25DRAFT_529638 [Hypoxylon fragiforme]